MKLWFTFRKVDQMVYVSYLDMLKTLARGIRRAGLLPVMSQGFNPQPKISFAHPLPLGVISELDYGEMELVDNEYIPKKIGDLPELINDKLPAGFELLDIKEPNLSKPPKLMSLVEATCYEFDCSRVLTAEELSREINNAWCMEEIVISKKRAKDGKIKNKDLKPLIWNIENQGTFIKGIFLAGSRGNLRPDELLTGIFNDEQVFKKVASKRSEIYFFKSQGQETPKPLWNWDLNN